MAETTLLSMRPTRLIAFQYYVGAVFLWVLAILTYVWLRDRVPNWTLFGAVTLRGILAWLLAFVGVLALLYAEIRRIATRYVVTDSRIVRYDGIVRRKTNQMPFNKVERVEMDQSLLQWVFKFGDIVLDTGEDTIVLESIGHVNLVQNELSKLVAAYSRKG